MANSKFAAEDLSRWKREINPAPIFSKRIKIQRENAEWVATCPPCFHDVIVGHPDKTPSFKVWKLADGAWVYKCFGCGANGNVFQFVQAFDKVSFTKAVERVLSEAGMDGWTDGEEQPEVDIPTAEKKASATAAFAEYKPRVASLEASPEGQEWLKDRGIRMEVARQFSIGFVQDATLAVGTNHPWAAKGWITFPILSADRQTVTAVKYRSLVAKKKKIDGKEVVGIRCVSSPTMYNLPTADLSGDVWIAEGEPDTLVLAQAGCQAVGYPGASYRPSDEECDSLSTAKRRFLAGDSDGAGTKAMGDLQKRLRGETYTIIWPNNRKDANDVLTNECGNDPAKFKALLADLVDRVTQIKTKPILRDGNTIEPCRINWLWENKIPLGKITLFAGNPDNGKSMASTSVAAICTRGDAYPGSRCSEAPSDVLMMLGEDDLDDTAVPRLMAAGADMKRIHFLEAARPAQMENREVRLDMDIPAVAELLEKNSKIRLIIIDPISNYLGEVSMVAEQEVRSILIPLKRLAEKYNVAVVLVMHLNKKADLDAISRVGGAMAFIGVARCSWLFARNPVEKIEGEEKPLESDPKLPDTFSMLRIKNNLVSASRSGLSYSIGLASVPVPNEPDMTVPFVQWGEVIDGTADDALGSRRAAPEHAPRREGPGRPNDKIQVAITWLENALQDGLPHPIKILREDARGEAATTPDTLDRAWKAIGGKAKKVKGVWCWYRDPMNAVSDPEDGEEPRQSNLIAVEGAE